MDSAAAALPRTSHLSPATEARPLIHVLFVDIYVQCKRAVIHVLFVDIYVQCKRAVIHVLFVDIYVQCKRTKDSKGHSCLCVGHTCHNRRKTVILTCSCMSTIEDIHVLTVFRHECPHFGHLCQPHAWSLVRGRGIDVVFS